MAALLSPCTILSRAPAPALVPRKLSPATALKLRKQPPPPPVVAALPWASSYGCRESRSRRAPLFTCHAKYKYSDMQPNALEACTLLAGENWNIMSDKDVIILKIKVGEPSSPPKDNKLFKVETVQDQAGLVIRYDAAAAGGDDSLASDLNVKLNIPSGYEVGKMKARLFEGWLIVMIAKPKHDPNDIPVQV